MNDDHRDVERLLSDPRSAKKTVAEIATERVRDVQQGGRERERVREKKFNKKHRQRWYTGRMSAAVPKLPAPEVSPPPGSRDHLATDRALGAGYPEDCCLDPPLAIVIIVVRLMRGTPKVFLASVQRRLGQHWR